MTATLQAGSLLPWLRRSADAPPVPLRLALQVGRARLAFDGAVSDLLGQRGLLGSYEISGPSLAAVGQPLRLTLPTTAPFAARGRLAHDAGLWSTVLSSISVGSSRLAGAFQVRQPGVGAGTGVPLLAGRLHGPVLVLQDLGPAVGVPLPGEAGARPPGARVLPNRPLDLPSLRAMDANVLLAIDRLDPGSALLQSVQPLRGQLLLHAGVLSLQGLDARLAQGRIAGWVQVDARHSPAQWSTDLRVAGLDIAQWIRPLRRASGPPYASGRLGGRLVLQGRGRSTAELLASADGQALLHWTRGSVSHLVVEAAGLDLAEALGVLLRGDKALAVTCGVADLQLRQGLVRPRLALVDTPDSLLRLEGTVSLASERLALVARVEPKDWSPLTLRTPLHIDGTLGQPLVSLEKGPLARRVLPAALLALAAPLAALLPLFDAGEAGSDTSGRAAAADCQAAAALWRAQRPPRKAPATARNSR